MQKAMSKKRPAVERVWNVRRELATGAYETPERVGAAIERLLEVLPPEPSPPLLTRESSGVRGGKDWVSVAKSHHFGWAA